MSNSPDEKLEAMLRSRRVEPASADLAARIILKTESIRQKQTSLLAVWLDGLFAEFHLSRPGYVLACTLLLGFLIGLSMPLDTNGVDTRAYTDASETINVQSFLYADEDLL